MDKKQAQQLIQQLFTQPFELERYRHFVRNLLNHYEERSGHYTGNYIPDAFKQHVNQYWRIGKYVDPDGNQLDLLVVEVKSLAKLERARSSLRNFAVNRLKQFEKEASLIAFYAQDDHGADWRFSFVKIEHEAYQDDKGKVKLKQELTPARRYSYLVGQHENSHTASRQLLPVLEMDYADPRIEEIEAAFSIEKITDEFFDQYKALFQKLAEHLKKQPWFKQASNEETDQAVSRFAKKLLGQIVFLYFLQKKGWLGAGKGKAWGEGSKRFLRERYQQTEQEGGNYYRDFLQFLFYEALACKREEQDDPGYYERFQCRIPFLNGGLFEADYDWRQTNIEIPNSLFHNDEKTKAGDLGTGILDVFDRYNFTIKEDEPLEKEVAVDPEMLGKVFENMLEITERKSKGAFYTPREIVHYMCQESLIHYLDNRLNRYGSNVLESEDKQSEMFGSARPQLEIGKEENILVPRPDLEILIRRGHLALENDTRVLSKGKETDAYKFQLPESVREHAKAIDEALADIKVCDPAIGSGAFPVGLLHEIVNARQALAPHSGNNQSAYELKRHAIAESIYGVDIEASAIDIARLRLWLSLIVDEEDYDNTEALPNLDYKIVRGDSLLGIDIDLFNQQLFNDIEAKKKAFFSTTDHDEKTQLAAEINALIHKLTKGSELFDFKVYFSEVWRKKSGFDIIIANPPYIKERDNKDIFESVKRSDFGRKHYSGKMDYWFFFLHRALELSVRNGVVSFITSRYWINSVGAKKLINQIRDTAYLFHVVDIGKLKVFDDVAGHHMVHFYKSSTAQKHCLIKKISESVKNIQKSKSDETTHIYSMTESEIFKNKNEIKIDRNDIKLSWDRSLNDFFFVSQGVVQNPDKVSSVMSKRHNLEKGEGVFVLDQDELDSINLNEKEIGFIKHFYEEKSICKYFIDTSSRKNLIYLTRHNCSNLNDLPNIENHLMKYRAIMDSRRETKKGAVKWFQVHWPREERFFESAKVVLPSMFKKSRAAHVEYPAYFGLGSNIVIGGKPPYTLKLLSFLLNSQFAEWWFLTNGKHRGAGVDIGVEKLRSFPLPDVWKHFSVNTENIVDHIKFLGADERKKLVRNFLYQLVDALVYELYFPDELKSTGKDILRHLGELTAITDDMSEEEKLAVIQREFDRLYDPRHPVRNIIETLDSVEVVRTIREALHRK